MLETALEVEMCEYLGYDKHDPAGRDGMAFPAFQFSADSGRPYDVVPLVLGEFAAAEVDPYTVATWLVTAQGDLDGRSPVSLLTRPTIGDPLAALLKVARGLIIFFETFLAGRRLLTTALASELQLADVTVPAASDASTPL